ncbi:MAG: exodeoxyribonuclease VII large subunit, partial [Clostridia bacterium]|nr:exodeoxyribonuclease VII large subunit [Clostridia bacterium]
MSFKPISVSQLNGYIRQIFDAEELLHGISVYGEISGWSYTRGTAYFTLKDEGGALSCVCFDIKENEHFKDGDSVMVIGSAKYYAKGGKLNFNVVKIEPYGESILYKKFLELKNKLEELGYFNPDNKKPIPKNIARIGVVTSAEGAVIQDIINVRTRRNPNIDIVLYPAKVQGINAEKEIAEGIKFLDQWNVDAIVVARGGGSMEDLMPFNTIEVADAIHDCNKFILSAVGHETDFTICDFCSDLRAPTPSAAAELLCSDMTSLKQKFRLNVSRLQSQAKRFIENNSAKIKNNIDYLSRSFDDIVQGYREMIKTNINYLI